jgi:ribosomal protein S18 acetylase RimI-like enzyme
MKFAIRPYEKADYARVLEICIAAFEPIHRGFEEALGSRIFKLQYEDWKEQYAVTLDRISPRDQNRKVHVVVLDGAVVGFVFTIIDAKRKTGEIGLNAVDPKLHGRGIGRAMYEFALKNLKERGAEIACVGTGGDAAHAPARRAYQAIGFDKTLPGLHLFKEL